MYLSDIKKWLVERGIDTLAAWELIDAGGGGPVPKNEEFLQDRLVMGLVVSIEHATHAPNAKFLQHDVPIIAALSPYLTDKYKALLMDAAWTPFLHQVVSNALKAE